MSTAAGAACGNKIIHIAREITQQNVVLHIAGGGLLVNQAGRRVSGIIGIAAAVRCGVLLAAVTAGNVDITVCRMVGGCRLVVLGAVACRAGVDNYGRGCSGIHLTVGAGDLSFIVNHQTAFYSAGGCICFAVTIGVNTLYISARNTNGHTLLVRQLWIRYRRDNGQNPGVCFFPVSPFLVGIVGEI